MVVERQVGLRFTGDGAAAGATSDLSAACRDGPWLWGAGYDQPRLQRLRVGSWDGACHHDRSHPNRHVVIRRPVADRDDDAVSIRSTAAGGPRRTAALLDGGMSDLGDVLSSDEHLVALPAMAGKTNELDVEGMAGLDHGRLLGLRGPVLSGWAVVVTAWIDASCSMSDGAPPRPIPLFSPSGWVELYPTGAIHGSGSLQ
jgi:hypothetical protein